MDQRPTKPVPRPSPETLPFWEGAKEKRLLLPCCQLCGKFWFPPSRRCPHCLSGDFEWREVKGTGRIYSFVVFHRVYHPAFEGDVPYTVAIVELEEGPRMLTNIVGIAPDRVRCDMEVRVVFEEERAGTMIPQFAPV
jgi:uncharacterized protein